MAIPFSRSLRSIQMDSMSWSITGLMISILLLGAWLIWFFFSPVSINEISKEVTVDDNGKILAKFPKKSLDRIESGQSADIRVEIKTSNSTQEGTKGISKVMNFSGIVMKVPLREVDQDGWVELAAIDDRFYGMIQNTDYRGYKYEAEVEVEKVTPFVLLQRAAREVFTSSQDNVLTP